MSCYHPLICIDTSNMLSEKERRIANKIYWRHRRDPKFKSSHTLLVPRELAEQEGLTLEDNNAVLVPCGHCIGCRLDYSRLWAERCVHEASQYEHNYFLTLSYDDEHLPKGKKGVPTLLNDEISKFMNSLRKHFAREYGHTGVRFLASAEYGDLDQRPHYHILLFNCPIPDLQIRHPVPKDGRICWIPLASDVTGEPLWYSPTIGKLWNKGLCPIGEVNFKTAAYVSRYIMKKQFGETAKYYDMCGILPPFLRMSRNPGIGANWYKDNFDKIIDNGRILLNRGDKVVSMSPSKYFYKLVKDYDEDTYYRIKSLHRMDMYDSINSKAYEGVEYTKHLNAAENKLKVSSTLLKRNL